MTGAPTGVHWWVTIKDGQGATVIARSDTGIVEVAPGVYTASRTGPTSLGTYTLVWDDGTIHLSEQLLVTTSDVIPTGQLCSLEDIKRADGGLANTGTTRDSLINDLILDATAAIQTWCDRQLIAGTGLETRVFPTGQNVEITDLAAIPALVEVVDASGVASPLAPTAWTVGPVNRRPGDSFTLLTTTATGNVRVTGVWGWPAVPRPARRACVQTVIHWLRGDRALTTPSPDQWAPGEPPQRMLPLQAMDMLRPYRVPVIA